MVHQDFIIHSKQIVGVGCSQVVQATHLASNDSNFAAKILDISVNKNDMLHTFYNEAQLLQLLNTPKNKNIVKLFTSYIKTNTAILIMEKLDGDLLDLILEQKLNLSQKLYIFKEICEGIKQCHDSNIAHLDIKPDNILCSKNSNNNHYTVKLADFGSSQLLEHSKAIDVKGTLHYNAPELFTQTRNGVNGKKADIWSLGILLHVLLTGTWPVRTNDPEELRKLLSSGKLHYSQHLTEEQHTFLTQLLAINPKNRPSINQILQSKFVSRPAANKLHKSKSKSFSRIRRLLRSQ